MRQIMTDAKKITKARGGDMQARAEPAHALTCSSSSDDTDALPARDGEADAVHDELESLAVAHAGTLELDLARTGPGGPGHLRGRVRIGHGRGGFVRDAVGVEARTLDAVHVVLGLDALPQEQAHLLRDLHGVAEGKAHQPRGDRGGAEGRDDTRGEDDQPAEHLHPRGQPPLAGRNEEVEAVVVVHPVGVGVDEGMLLPVGADGRQPCQRLGEVREERRAAGRVHALHFAVHATVRLQPKQCTGDKKNKKTKKQKKKREEKSPLVDC